MAHPSHTAYDCLICDIALEAISGIELLRRLRAAGLHTPCIFVTANATSCCREQARKHGAVCMLDKPVDPDDLVGWLSRVLNTAS